MKEQNSYTTPMLEQYLSIKSNYSDILLFYRMGDFYELFFEDAEIAAKELQITLTARNTRVENPIPMCGVPWHSAENYIHQLTKKGYKVALCEQLEDSRQTKGLVQRKVTRVFTSATSTEDIGLEPKTHTYLGAIYWDEHKSLGSFCWVDVSTGFWTGIQVKNTAELWQWVQKIYPKELLYPDKQSIPDTIKLLEIHFVPLPFQNYFEYSRAQQRLIQAQEIIDIHSIGLEKQNVVVQSCGALLAYLEQTQMQDAKHLMPFKPLNIGKYLIIDEITEENLELFRRLDGKKGVGTVIHTLDHTVTPMGGRLLEERLHQPWKEQALIVENQNAVEWFVQNKDIIQKLKPLLKCVYDLERLSTRIAFNRASPKDLLALKNTFIILPEIQQILTNITYNNVYPTEIDTCLEHIPQMLRELIQTWDNFFDYAETLSKALDENPPNTTAEGGIFKLGFNTELDSLLDLIEHGESKLQELLKREQTIHNIPKLKIGFNRVFGYYFELTRSVHAPSHFIRRQTLANAERFTTEELKDLEERLFSATEKRNTLEYKLFQELRENLVKIRPRILLVAQLIAQLDFWQSSADVALLYDWCKPVVDNFDSIHIHEGRHPVIEHILGRSVFVPNDIVIDETKRMILITGPNMAGKSTILRQTAIICLLAQMGLYVPATKAHISICDRIFSRVGASDNLAQGQSTFMIEMVETARILRLATQKSLVILDEIGRGTSTFDGLALAWAVAEDLINKGAMGVKTLFATHYHELSSLDTKLPKVYTMTVAIQHWNNELVFLRKLIPGPADKSYGIEVAKIAGVPQPVIQRAKAVLKQLEQTQSQPSIPYFSQTMLTLLKEESNKEEEFLVENIKEEHPIVEILTGLNPEELTPLEALSFVTKWKELWGTSVNA